MSTDAHPARTRLAPSRRNVARYGLRGTVSPDACDQPPTREQYHRAEATRPRPPTKEGT